jgi:hypothetical protein
MAIYGAAAGILALLLALTRVYMVLYSDEYQCNPGASASS